MKCKHVKDHKERIINEEHDWDCNVEVDAVEDPVG